MKFVISGYTDKLSLIELDNKFNLLSQTDYKINSSSFIVVDEYIYCYDRENNPYIYMLDINTLSLIDKIKVNINNITHLAYSKKNEVLYGCSYVGGTFFALKINNNKFDTVIDVIREEDINTLSRCHCLLLNKNEDILVVVNIATDKLNFYKVTSNSVIYDKTINLPLSCGPRHAIYSKDENYIYVMTEYSNEVIVVDINTKEVVTKYSTLINKNITSYGATLFLDDRYLYASNRGEESIATFDVLNEKELIYRKSIPVFGKHSRHMINSKDNKYIISCNKNTNNICVIDKKIDKLVYELSFDNPSCIVEI